MVVISVIRPGRAASIVLLLIAGLIGGGFVASAGHAPAAPLQRTPVGVAAAPFKPADFMTNGSGGSTAKAAPMLLASPTGTSVATVVNTPVCAAVYDQSSPSMVSDEAGGGFVCWDDYRDGSNLDIYAQRLDPQGVPLWAPDGAPVCKANGPQWYPRSVADGTGGVIIVWQDARTDTTYDIYAQRLSADGIPLWTADGVPVCTQSASQSVPLIAADGFGGAVVVWTDSRNADRDLFAQRINASGAIQWAASGVPVCTSVGDQTNPSIISDTQGGALIVWLDARAGSLEVFAQRIISSGTASWTANGVAVCTALGLCEAPVVAADGAGGMIAAWGDARGASFDIYAQRFNSAGVPQWAVNGVAMCSAGGDQRLPSLSADNAGGAYLTWQDARGANLDIYAQRVGSDGAAAWTANGVSICAAAANQVTPSIQTDPAGGAFVTWSDGRTPVNGMDVYGQRVSGTGTPSWTANGVLLSDGSGNQDLPKVVANGLGGAVMVWRDFRPGTNSDIYGQRVDAAGAVSGPCPTTTVALASQAVVTSAASPAFYDFPQADFYWAGVGVRTDSLSDWDLEIFDPNTLGFGPYPVCFATPKAASYRPTGVDFVMANFNLGMTWPDDYNARIVRYSGTGSASLEWDADQQLMQKDCGTGGGCGSKPGNNWNQVLDVWDIFLFEGQTYVFDFTRTGDIKMALFAPGPGGDQFVPRSASVFETSNRFTVFTVPGVLTNPPTLQVYGVVLVNDGGTVGTYTVRVNTGASVGVDEGAAPSATLLQGLRPNPAVDKVEIRYALDKAGSVGFQVFDMAGRKVSEIAPHERTAGSWSITWNGRGASGQALSPGVYFVHMKVNGVGVGTSRLALVR